MTTTTQRRPAKSRGSARVRRPQMTAGEATDFVRISLRSACIIEEAIKERREAGCYPGCRCEPYDDVFTFARWRAQGYFVRKGEKSLRLATWVPIAGTAPPAPVEEGADPPATVGRPRLKPKTTFLFCRCQVERLAE